MSLRSLSFAFLIACFSMPAMAQQPQADSTTAIEGRAHGMMPMFGMMSDQQIDRAISTLQQTLNLSAAQVSNLRQMAQSRRDAMQAIREQTRPKFRALLTLMDQPNPDPTAVGRAALDLKDSMDQARAKQAEFRQRFMAMLTPAQQQTVNNVLSQAPTFTALHALGLATMRQERGAEISE